MPLCSGWSSARTVDLDHHEPAQARRERGTPGREVRGVGQHDHVGASRSRCARRKSARCSEPISSSPSTRTFTFTGSAPCAARQARSAARWSSEPGLVVDDAAAVQPAVVAPVGSNGGVRQCARAPGRLHVVVRVDEHRRRVGPRPEPLAVHRRGAHRRRAAARRRREPRVREQLRHALRAAHHLRGSKPGAETLGMRARPTRSAMVRSKPASKASMTGAICMAAEASKEDCGA